MSAREMRVFLPALREIERGLAVPIPRRVRILRELEFDLEELRSRLVSQGITDEEARARAVEVLVPDGESLRELGWLHTPVYRRITRHLQEGRLRLFERAALALTAASVLLLGTLALLRANLLDDPSPFLWPVLGMGAILFAAIAGKVFRLWIQGDHRKPEAGLGAILLLSGAIFSLGFVGALTDFYRLSGILERASGPAGALVAQWLIRASALLSVSILLALAGSLCWFVLCHWLALVSGDYREVLGIDG